MGVVKCSYSLCAAVVESVHGALCASLAGPSTRKSLFWELSGALTVSRTASGTRGAGLDEGGAFGMSLRSTRGPTSGWLLALSGLERVAGLFWGPALAGLEALMVSAVLSLAGLLRLSATELVAAEGSKFTTVEVVSAAAGLCEVHSDAHEESTLVEAVAGDVHGHQQQQEHDDEDAHDGSGAQA
ncbi:hypothetical protein EYF80_010626 [Liparis tanakae]|uniref:Uncharacterized protein n=1 Tax=Liparis tanakae TaxID=230148 RepID=A0A4Z2IN88_9TELE|nr:hypothetical protein EYF80_010626 [Liparis tanakae]